MSAGWQDFDRRVAVLLEQSPSRIPVLVGQDGCGRTTTLVRLAHRFGPARCLRLDLERLTSTPERFAWALTTATPFRCPPAPGGQPGPASAFREALQLLTYAHLPGGGPAVFLLDEWLELRTFEHFPGLRNVIAQTLAARAASGNHFVLTSRYITRTLRELADAPERLTVVPMPDMAASDVAAELMSVPGYRSDRAEEFAAAIVALSGGRVGYVRALVDALRQDPGLGDPVSALTSCLSLGGTLDRACRYAYELRLHRARGYGALKAVLGVLAVEEPLSLTDVAVRLGRTAGSTRDYLAWLEDVDLVVARRKRYAFADPILRLWVGIFEESVAGAGDEAVAAAVQRFAIARLSAGGAS